MADGIVTFVDPETVGSYMMDIVIHFDSQYCFDDYLLAGELNGRDYGFRAIRNAWVVEMNLGSMGILVGAGGYHVDIGVPENANGWAVQIVAAAAVVEARSCVLGSLEVAWHLDFLD